MNTESLALDFKSATLYAIRVVLHSADPERLSAALAKRMADAGSFFENEPVVVDASRVEETIDWPALIAAARAQPAAHRRGGRRRQPGSGPQGGPDARGTVHAGPASRPGGGHGPGQ